MADREKLRKLAITIATIFFRGTQNPAYQGPNFSWENFPEMVARLAETSVFMSFPGEKLTRDDEQFAAQVARETAIKLVGSARQQEEWTGP